MAYFSNGSEGEVLDAQCAECPVGSPDLGCPVALAHLLYNYDQFDDRGNRNKLSEALNVLVNEQGECLMRRAILSAEETMRKGTTCAT